MSATAPSTIKSQLVAALGPNGRDYWENLNGFIVGKISRQEFEDVVREWINTPELVHLHNSFLLTMISSAGTLDPPDTKPDGPQQPHNKRRRLLPHQDPPPKLKKWVIGLGKRERETLKNNPPMPFDPNLRDDEIILDRGVRLRAEGKNPAGTRVALPLSTSIRALPNLQNLTDRVTLIASQHNLTASKRAIHLLASALEAYLKNLSMHALSLTSGCHPFSSIQPASPSPMTPLSLSAFETLFTISPSEIPNLSATSITLETLKAESEHPIDDGSDGAEGEDVNAQLMKLMKMRSAFRARNAGRAITAR
jgi:hypothetical protein